MKKMKLKMAALIILSGISSGVFSQGFSSTNNSTPSDTHGGFGGSKGVSSVAGVKSLHDDAWVALEGSIVRQTGHERYEFRDTSGSIMVEIDDENWYGQQVTPANRVHIEGEVDRNWGPTEIDVKNLKVIK